MLHLLYIWLINNLNCSQLGANLQITFKKHLQILSLTALPDCLIILGLTIMSNETGGFESILFSTIKDGGMATAKLQDFEIFSDRKAKIFCLTQKLHYSG